MIYVGFECITLLINKLFVVHLNIIKVKIFGYKATKYWYNRTWYCWHWVNKMPKK